MARRFFAVLDVGTHQGDGRSGAGGDRGGDQVRKELTKMTHLASIALRSCKIHTPWTAAPDGTLLQIRKAANDSPIIGLKFQIPRTIGIPLDYFLRLDGDEIGRWEALNTGIAALDVSEQFEIHAFDPAPRPLDQGEKIGFLYAHEDEAIFMFAHKVDVVEVRGYVCVRQSKAHHLGPKVHQLGMLYDELDFLRLYELGKGALKTINSN